MEEQAAQAGAKRQADSGADETASELASLREEHEDLLTLLGLMDQQFEAAVSVANAYGGREAAEEVRRRADEVEAASGL